MILWKLKVLKVRAYSEVYHAIRGQILTVVIKNTDVTVHICC